MRVLIEQVAQFLSLVKCVSNRSKGNDEKARGCYRATIEPAELVTFEGLVLHGESVTSTLQLEQESLFAIHHSPYSRG
jgi:hypothetical protein